MIFLFLVDGVLAARALRGERIAIRRERPARLSLGGSNEIAIVLDHRGGQPRSILLRDEPPAEFPAEPAILTAILPARGRLRLTYQLRPTARGNFSFGGLTLRCRGPDPRPATARAQ